jgi:hypothetical protein
LLRLFESDARFQAAHDEQPVEIMIDLFRLEDQGDRELGILAIEDACALHADDCIGLAIHAQGGTDNLGICAELHPQLMGEDDDVIAAGHGFFRQEEAPHQKRLAQHLRHAVGFPNAIDELRLIPGGQVELAPDQAQRSWNTVLCCFQSRKSPAATPLW